MKPPDVATPPAGRAIHGTGSRCPWCGSTPTIKIGTIEIYASERQLNHVSGDNNLDTVVKRLRNITREISASLDIQILSGHVYKDHVHLFILQDVQECAHDDDVTLAQVYPP